MISANLTFMASEKPDAQVVLKVPDESQPKAIVDVATLFDDTHWGTQSAGSE
jgi:hypothetical protein